MTVIFTGERFCLLQLLTVGMQLQPKGRFPPMNACICHLSRSYISGMYIYPCFSLHPGINAPHYPNNSAPNYENFLFKRLFSISKKLFNCCTHPYQRKSRCPCQKTRLLLTTKHQRTVSPLQITHLLTSYADVYQDNTASFPPEPLIGSSAVMSCGNTTHSAQGAERAEVIHVLAWRNTLK